MAFKILYIYTNVATMKMLICLLLLIAPTIQVSAQLSTYDFEMYPLEEEGDYKAAEADALTVANLLLASPLDDDLYLREEAIYFLLA